MFKMSKIMGLGVFTLCVYVATMLERAGDSMLLASSSWYLVPLLVVIEAVGTFFGIIKGYRSILEV